MYCHFLNVGLELVLWKVMCKTYMDTVSIVLSIIRLENFRDSQIYSSHQGILPLYVVDVTQIKIWTSTSFVCFLFSIKSLASIV